MVVALELQILRVLLPQREEPRLLSDNRVPAIRFIHSRGAQPPGHMGTLRLCLT